MTNLRHKRRGYVSRCDFTRPGDTTKIIPAIDGNDGL